MRLRSKPYRELSEPGGSTSSDAPSQPTAIPLGLDSADVFHGASPSLSVSSPEFAALIERATGSISRSGNSVELLPDGATSFDARRKMIEAAKSSICFETFIFDSDDTGWEMAQLLADAAQRGVKVRVIYDAIGSARADPKLFRLMLDSGVEVRAHGPMTQLTTLNNRWHEKYLICDGQEAILGGANIADEYALTGTGVRVVMREGRFEETWRDTDFHVRGPTVADITRGFLRNWEELAGPVSEAERSQLFPPLTPQPNGVSMGYVQSNPLVPGKEQNLKKLQILAIENAQSELNIEHAYYLPDADYRRALIAAVKRGVRVSVLTNSKRSVDISMVAEAARYFYDELVAAGVKIFEGQEETIHSKYITVDGQLCIGGSGHINGRAQLDSESELWFSSVDRVRQLNARFEAALKDAREVTLAELQKESFMTNLKQWALSTFAWTF